MNINDFLKQMVEAEASDLIIKSDGVPAVRVDGKLSFLSDEALSAEEVEAFCNSLFNDDERRQFQENGEVDLSYHPKDIGRFRLNVFKRQGRAGIVFRHIRETIPEFEELGLPVQQMERIAQLQRGLVLVTGIAGSGKSTTIASALQYINRREQKHIITIEDPIEYQYFDDKCVICQREVGTDTATFASALKHCMRQSPDVILIGEMRDRETMEAAINAAETGHLVLSTLHTVNAVQTVERIMNLFPPEQHNLIRLQLSLNLEAVVSQRLLPRKGNGGRMPAVEILINTPLIGELLAEGRTRMLNKALRNEHSHYGTQTFNQSLCELYNSGKIELREAKLASENPEDLELEIRGIQRGSDMSRMPTDRYTRKDLEEKEAGIVTGKEQFDL